MLTTSQASANASAICTRRKREGSPASGSRASVAAAGSRASDPGVGTASVTAAMAALVAYAGADRTDAAIEQHGSIVVASFPEAVTIDHLVLEEALEDGQRIRSHTVHLPDSPEPLVRDVLTVGSHRVHAFPAVTTRSMAIEVDSPAGRLRSVVGHLTCLEHVPGLEDQPDFDRGKVH